MAFQQDQLTIGYTEFVQLYRANRISSYAVDGFLVNVPIGNLLRRKAHLSDIATPQIRGDWESAAQAREIAFMAGLSDEDFIYLHVCVDTSKEAPYNAASVTIQNPDGTSSQVYVSLEEDTFRQQVLTPAVAHVAEPAYVM